jgi:hypothetical protein
MTNGQPLVNQFTVADSAWRTAHGHVLHIGYVHHDFDSTTVSAELWPFSNVACLPISRSFPRPSLERHWFVFRAGMKRNGDLRNPQPQKLQLLYATIGNWY